jgi:Zn finger protein HypA/HybF involved in hydrogenase expression
MGGHNIQFKLDGKLSRSEVLQAVKRQRESDAEENGHQEGYSGDWQTISDISFPSQVFSTYNEAWEYASNKCEKWSGMSLRFKECPKEKLQTATQQKLVKKVKDLYTALSELERKEKAKVLEGKSTYLKCNHCSSKLAREHLRSVSCPVCHKDMLPAPAVARIEKAKAKVNEAKQKLTELEKQLSEKHGKEQWLVFGFAAS